MFLLPTWITWLLQRGSDVTIESNIKVEKMDDGLSGGSDMKGG